MALLMGCAALLENEWCRGRLGARRAIPRTGSSEDGASGKASAIGQSFPGPDGNFTYEQVFELMQKLDSWAAAGDKAAGEEYAKILSARLEWGARPSPETWAQIFLVAQAAQERIRGELHDRGCGP